VEPNHPYFCVKVVTNYSTNLKYLINNGEAKIVLKWKVWLLLRYNLYKNRDGLAPPFQRWIKVENKIDMLFYKILKA
jgi:hypothetical protein